MTAIELINQYETGELEADILSDFLSLAPKDRIMVYDKLCEIKYAKLQRSPAEPGSGIDPQIQIIGPNED
jgi:hypothetical protein